MSPIIIQAPAAPTTFTTNVQGSLAPFADQAGNWQALNAALAAMFEPVYSLVADQGSPELPNYLASWSTLLDPVNCPTWALPFLGMFVGVPVAPGTADGPARAAVNARAGFNRGTAAAVTAAVRNLLTGTRTVYLVERAGGAYQATVVVRPGEAAGTSVQAIQAAIAAVKPAGVVFTVVLSDQFIFNQATGTFSADTLAWSSYASTQP